MLAASRPDAPARHLELVPSTGTRITMTHRQPERPARRNPLVPEHAPSAVAALVARTALIVFATNFAVGAVLIVAPGGASPALLFLRAIMPLQGWGLVFVAVAALGMLGWLVAANTLAVALWAFLALGAVTGLVTGTTASPAGSMILFVLVASVSVLHVSGLWFRRQVARAARPPGQ